MVWISVFHGRITMLIHRTFLKEGEEDLLNKNEKKRDNKIW
jgi:hypothetical protein